MTGVSYRYGHEEARGGGVQAVIERTVADLRVNSERIVTQAENEDVLLRGSHGVDVLLVDSLREAAIRQALVTTAAIMADTLTAAPQRELFEARLTTVLPWTEVLSPDDRRRFLHDVQRAARRTTEHHDVSTLSQVITEWLATATLLRDPEAMKAFSEVEEQDIGGVDVFRR
jgi:hypothetical protein